MNIVKKVLLVEDDDNLGNLLKDYLQLRGQYLVVLCKDGNEGLRTFKEQTFDICILDVMMPQKDGFSLGKEIRQIAPNVPMIYVTAKTMLEDKTHAFGLGADDYITKPFSIDEILLRIDALMRRVNRAEEEISIPLSFSIGLYHFDYSTQTIKNDDVEQKLSTKEAELLRLLCLKKNEVLTRQEALIAIWNNDSYFNGRSMDVFLSKLRKYLKEDPRVEILNVHGKGFKLVSPN